MELTNTHRILDVIYPGVSDLSLSKLDEALANCLPSGRLQTKARESILKGFAVPAKGPDGDDGGYHNNADLVLRLLLAASMAQGVGATERAKELIDAAIGWMRLTHRDPANHRDEQHRHLIGIFLLWVFARENGMAEVTADCEWCMGQVFGDHMGIHKLEDYKDTPNLRTIMRASENSLTGAYYLAMRGGQEGGVREILAKVAPVLNRYLAWKHEPPPAGGRDREAPGWGIDSDGVPFHVDHLGRSGDKWHEQGENGMHMPWQEFMLQLNALHTMIRLLRAISDLGFDVGDFDVQLMRDRIQDLMAWHWMRGYNNDSEPLHRGYGRTAAWHVFKSIDPLQVALAGDLGIATGEMLWASWNSLRHLPEDSFRSALPLFLEAFVTQALHHNWSDWHTQLTGPEFLQAISRWYEAEDIDEADPSLQSEIREALKVLRVSGQDRVADYLSDSLAAMQRLIRSK